MSIPSELRHKRGFLTVNQVADLTGSHPITVHRWTKQGKMPSLRIGGRVRIDPRSLADWLDSRTVQTEVDSQVRQ